MYNDMILLLNNFGYHLLLQKSPLTETLVVRAGPVKGVDRGCRNQKTLDYEIETPRVRLRVSSRVSCRNQKTLDYEIETMSDYLHLQAHQT